MRPGVALVTGGARRIGRAIATDLARAGWTVAVHYRNARAAAEDLAAEIAAGGGHAALIEGDLGDEAATRTLIQRAALLGPLTCLVNNAATFEPDTIETVDRATWSRHIEPNLWAPLILTQEFARALPAGREGCVINILDQRVWNLTPNFLSYTVSKAGLWAVTQTLALALAPRIRVNGIGPGPTLPSERQSPAHFAEQVARTPLARAATPDEIAAAVRFILASPSLTGQMIALDGGQHLGWAVPTPGHEPITE
ncbi:MAG: SDR family oxidoreductase [Alphaproteobacteria bacterium]|nr:SDR family oxidoreductase [Alphaproteobacteria bacterium]